MTVVLTDAQAQDAHLLGLLYKDYGKLLLTYEEAALALGVHASTVKRKMKHGLIEKTTIGGRVCIPITEVVRITREGI